jgi:hypothetical protein
MPEHRNWNFKHQRPALALGITIALLLTGWATVSAVQPPGPMLVKILLRSRTDRALVEASALPVYTQLTSEGGFCLLAGATPAQTEALRDQGLDVAVLDPNIQGATYYLLSAREPARLLAAEPHVEMLYRDEYQAVVRSTPAAANQLAADGFEIATLSLDPVHLHPRTAGGIPESVQADPFVAAMIAQVDVASLRQYEAWLTGEEAAEVGGSPYTITTRNTYSGTPIQKATQGVYEHLESLGLETEYHHWGEITYPNVIATKPGLAGSDDTFIICAHLDDKPSGPVAPGADDNASGTAGVLVAADILSQYQFDCTLKFALWTGEEQGLLGSDAWATWAANQDLNILGVLNMDMIAHDSDTAPIVDVHARSQQTDSVAMANLFANAVDAYELELEPEVLVDHWLGDYSDNKSFWDEGYPAIMVIEDRDDFTPHYHTVSDTLSTLNMAYFSEFVKASLATYVHMSGCLVREGAGSLDGRILVDTGSPAGMEGIPVANAAVSIQDKAGYAVTALADGTGYYTQTLPAGVYTVTASAQGFLPATVSGAVVFAGATTGQDLQLEAVPVVMVRPRALEPTLSPAIQVTRTVWLTNTGKAELDFRLHELGFPPKASTPDITWLASQPASGNVGPGQGIPIKLTFDGAGLQPGRYVSVMDLESNDPITPHLGIPVTLTVMPPCIAAYDAGLAWEPPSARVGESITFRGTASGTQPISFTWGFGDGNKEAGQLVTHAYGHADSYRVVLTATNCGTVTDTVTHAVRATPWRLYLPIVSHRP